MAVANLTDCLDVVLLEPRAHCPTRSHEGDAGYDLHCLDGFVLDPGQREVVSTGIAVALPPGIAGLVIPRSGLAARCGLSVVNGPGLIDPNYRGEIRVLLINLGAEPFVASGGDRIAQLLLVPFWSPTLRVVDDLNCGGDARGMGGLGSTGR